MKNHLISTEMVFTFGPFRVDDFDHFTEPQHTHVYINICIHCIYARWYRHGNKSKTLRWNSNSKYKFTPEKCKMFCLRERERAKNVLTYLLLFIFTAALPNHLLSFECMMMVSHHLPWSFESKLKISFKAKQKLRINIPHVLLMSFLQFQITWNYYFHKKY